MIIVIRRNIGQVSGFPDIVLGDIYYTLNITDLNSWNINYFLITNFQIIVNKFLNLRISSYYTAGNGTLEISIWLKMWKMF